MLVNGAVEADVDVCTTGELWVDAVDKSFVWEVDASIGISVTVVNISTGALDDSGNAVSSIVVGPLKSC